MSSRPTARQQVLAYAGGSAVILLVTVVRIGLTPIIGDSVALLPFMLPVIVAALIGGFTPALVLTAASLVTADWFLMKPRYSLTIGNPDEVVRMLMFIVVGVAVALLGERQRRATDRLRDATQRLASSESRLRRFADANLVGIVTSHVSGEITEANDAFLRMIGRTREELDGGQIQWRELTPPEHIPSDEKGIAEALSRGACVPYEKEYFHKDGHRVPVIIGYARVGADDFIVFVLDLTDRKRFEEQLRAAKDDAEAANASKDEFLMVVSHELRTPMTALLGWVQMLLMGHVDEKDVRSAVERIHESAVAEIEIIENILDVARLAVGKFVTRQEKVDVSVLAEAALAQFQARASERMIILDGKIEQRQLVIGDSDRLRQVFNSLLSNALKFTEANGHISLAVSNSDGKVRVEIADSGIGISKEFLPHVFDRFRQADEARSRRYGGLGLGLAIARHLVEAHGGTIHAESDGPGTGARFVVELPALGG